MKRILLFLMIVLSISACNLPATFKPPPTITPSPQPPLPTLVHLEVTSTPTQALLPSETPGPTNTPTLKPYTPYKISLMVDHVNVRSNPGYLFPVLSNLPKETTITVLGKSPGGDWIYAQLPSNDKGWIFAALIQTGGDLETAPIIQPEKIILVEGQLHNEAGLAISAIQFTLTQGTGQNLLRNDAVTDSNGNFYAFMPETAKGDWTISYTAVGCNSNIMDENCKCKTGLCGNPNPESGRVTLPQSGPMIFTWK